VELVVAVFASWVDIVDTEMMLVDEKEDDED